MRAESYILIEMDPILSSAIAEDQFAGRNFDHVLRDVSAVASAAILEGEPAAEFLRERLHGFWSRR